MLIGSVAMRWGYLRSRLKSILRYDDLEFGRFLQSYQHAYLRIGTLAGFRWCIQGGHSQLYSPGMVAIVSVAGFFLWCAVDRSRPTENSFTDPI